MSEKMPGMGDKMVEQSEAEMRKRLQAKVEEPNFYDTHIIDKSGNIIPKGETWDHSQP